MAANQDRQRLREITSLIQAKREIIQRLKDEIKAHYEERADAKRRLAVSEQEDVGSLEER